MWLLCLFHVKQALMKQVISKRGTLSASQRKQIVDEFISFVETAPVQGWEPQFAAYKARWEGSVADSWWDYLHKEWLCDEWRCLLFIAEREVFARLYIETTNGIELVWRVFKYDWLLHRRVSTYAIAFRLLFGLPWEPESAFLSLTGRIILTLAQIRAGVIRPPVRRRVLAMLDKVTPLLQRADDDPSFLQLDAEDPCWGAIATSSSTFFSGPTACPPLHEASVNDPSGAVSLLNDARREAENGRNVPANVANAVFHVRRIVSGQAASERRHLARQSGMTGPAHRAREPALSCADAAGAVLPAIADPCDAERRFSVVRILIDASNSLGAAVNACDAAQRDFEPFRYDGRSAGRSKQAITERGEIVLGYFKLSVFEGIAAFMPHRAAVTVADKANNNARVASALLSGWPMVERSNFTEGGDDSVPHFGMVYAVLWTAAASVWLAECHRLFLRHETRSLVFPEQLPIGYCAMLFEIWQQLEYLVTEGRGSESYTLPYIGQERHEETDPGTRAGAHGTRAGCPNAVHISFTTGRESNRRVISPLGEVRRDVRMLCALPVDCPLALNFAEATAEAFFAGSGVTSVNTGPAGNRRGMIDARGRLEPLVDVLLRQRLGSGQGGWGFKGCSERTIADEPSYWLRRLLAPVEYKWLCGLRLELPPAQTHTVTVNEVSNSQAMPVFQVAGESDSVDSVGCRLVSSTSASHTGILQSDTAVSITTSAFTSAAATATTMPVPAAITGVRSLLRVTPGRRHQPTYIEVVEASQLFDLGDDWDATGSSLRYTFCLWCNACDCPVSASICKHLVAGRIEYRRDG
jgi:hypothetical protein